jgi:hypothetical protein
MERGRRSTLARSMVGGICALAMGLGCAGGSVASDRRTTPEQSAHARSEVAVAQSELEAARRHPIAHPEPRTTYPEQQPPARTERGLPEQSPPPRETRTAPEQAPPPREEAAPAAQLEPAETRVVAPQPPPEPYVERAPIAPAPEYVWAPGYWYWYDSRYVWVPGGWLPPRHGHVYVSARWVHGPDGWVFAPGGWAVTGGSVVVWPLYRHRHFYGRHPYSHWHGSHRHHHYGHDRGYDHRRRDYRAPHREPSRSSHRTSVRPSTGDSARTRYEASDRSWNRTSIRPDGRGERSYNRAAVRSQSLSRGNRIPRSAASPAPRRGGDRGRR